MIEVNNLTSNRVDEEFLKGVAKKVLRGENKKIAELSIAIVPGGIIKDLNRKYRKKDKVTDILSFRYDKNKTGELIICLQEIKKNAKRFKSTFKEELAKILIHGVLHLLGHTHKTMAKKENYYLSKVK